MTIGSDLDEMLEAGGVERALERAREGAALQGDPQPLVQQAKILARVRRFDEAHDALAQALDMAPDHPGAHFVLGCLHKQQNATKPAAACFEHVRMREPSNAEARYELGKLYRDLGRVRDALCELEQAHALDASDLRFANELASVLVTAEQYERAIDLLMHVCARTSPAVIPPRIILSDAFIRSGCFERGLDVLEEILAVEPNNVNAHWNRAHPLLAMGQYAQGWDDYDFRCMLKSRPARLLPWRAWNGEPLEGTRVLIAAEQGLGDEIMFASCVPEVVRRAAAVHIECEPRLAPLFARSFPHATVWPSDHETVPPWLPDLPKLDYLVRAGTLPRFFRSKLEDFPAHGGYLRAHDARVQHWRDRLGTLGPGMKIGLSWRGGSARTRASQRSIPLGELKPVLDICGCHFVSLQYGDVHAELDSVRREGGAAIEHWPEAIDDYDETAALVSALDLVVSVQTAVVHLSGALGKAAWVLVPAAPEWRYGAAGERMPWYPAVRLFRQSSPGDWAEAVVRLGRELAGRATGK